MSMGLVNSRSILSRRFWISIASFLCVFAQMDGLAWVADCFTSFKAHIFCNKDKGLDFLYIVQETLLVSNAHG